MIVAKCACGWIGDYADDVDDMPAVMHFMTTHLASEEHRNGMDLVFHLRATVPEWRA